VTNTPTRSAHHREREPLLDDWKIELSDRAGPKGLQRRLRSIVDGASRLVVSGIAGGGPGRGDRCRHDGPNAALAARSLVATFSISWTSWLFYSSSRGSPVVI
jgi:hypothetical protein